HRLRWPGVTVYALVLLFAVYAFMDAGLEAVRAFSSRTAGPVFGHLLGLISLAAGVVAGLAPRRPRWHWSWSSESGRSSAAGRDRQRARQRGDRGEPGEVHPHRTDGRGVRGAAVRPPERRRGHPGAAVRPVQLDLRCIADRARCAVAPDRAHRAEAHGAGRLSRRLI